MPFPCDAFDDLHRHLSAAMLLLGECVDDVPPGRREQMVQVARHLTYAQQAMTGPTIAGRPDGAALPQVLAVVDAGEGEGEDERIERKAAEARGRAEQVLATLGLAAGERRFAEELGHRLVDAASDAYRESVRQAKGYHGRCIPAAAAFALAIVYDPADCRRTG